MVPDSASFQRLQALEDAIRYRTARLAAPCPDCEPGGSRCDEHACDARLIAGYQQAASQLAGSMTAARETCVPATA
jgi:hypothetical protein